MISFKNQHLLYKRKMAQHKEKEKSKKFLLPSSLKHIQEHYKHETESFVKNLNKSKDEYSQSKKQQKHQSLFKLNPSSSALVSEVPISTLRERSKSQKLQTLHNDPQKQGFSLLDHYKQTQQKQIQQKKPILKNYKIDIRNMVTGENKFATNNQEDVEQEPESYEIVKPSQPYIINKSQRTIFEPTIFQTPILPCFSTQFKRNIAQTSKTVQEGQGTWRIGKIRVKGKRCDLKIGEFLFEGEQVRGEGRAGLLTEQCLYSLPNWKDMWILQPHESLFTSD